MLGDDRVFSTILTVLIAGSMILGRPQAFLEGLFRIPTFLKVKFSVMRFSKMNTTTFEFSTNK